MGKKKKKPSPALVSPKLPAPSRPAAAAEPADGKSIWTEIRQHPTFLMAWISLAITLFSIGATIHFRDDPNAGAIREPTGTILWAAITVTLFASYWRECRRQEKVRVEGERLPAEVAKADPREP